MGNICLKVLHVGSKNYPPNHGGVEKLVLDLVRGMQDVECHIFTEWQSPDMQPRVTKLSKNLFSAWKQTRRYALENGIDIIHLHKETFIPLALLLKVNGHRCVLTIHGCAWRLKRWPLYTRILLFSLDYLACCFLDRTVFVGEYDWRLFKKIVPFRKLLLIRNGVTLHEPLHVPKKDSMVYLGRISPEKNILRLIEAAEAAGVEVDLYGPFDRRDNKFRKAILERLHSSRYAHWKGPVALEDIQSTLSMYRVFINPSFSEGLPVSVLEAAAEGLYLILSDISQHRLLKMPECTYIDPYAIDLTRVLSIRNSEGQRNREHVKCEFDVRKMVQAYSDIYRSLI